MKFNIISQ